VHVLPVVRDALLRVLDACGLRLRTRVPALLPPPAAPAPLLEMLGDAAGARRSFYEAVSRDAAGLRAALRGGRGAAARAFVGFATMGEEATRDRVRAALRRALDVAQSSDGAGECGGEEADFDAEVEWMVHPGLRTADGLAPADAGCGGLEADDFARSHAREAEMRLLAPAADGRCALREFVEDELGAQLVS
jgi:hypothetical protein